MAADCYWVICKMDFEFAVNEKKAGWVIRYPTIAGYAIEEIDEAQFRNVWAIASKPTGKVGFLKIEQAQYKIMEDNGKRIAIISKLE